MLSNTSVPEPQPNSRPEDVGGAQCRVCTDDESPTSASTRTVRRVEVREPTQGASNTPRTTYEQLKRAFWAARLCTRSLDLYIRRARPAAKFVTHLALPSPPTQGSLKLYLRCIEITGHA
jgi:hypothetical protein